MRRTGLAAVGVAAFLAFEGAIASAMDGPTQEVTIDVTSTALSISATGNATLSIPATGAPFTAITDHSTQLTFHNPPGSDGTATLTIGRTDGPPLGLLTLTASIPDGEFSWTGTQTSFGTLRSSIPQGPEQTVNVAWTLSGTAPGEHTDIVSSITYAIFHP